jgi:hypothetical protein
MLLLVVAMIVSDLITGKGILDKEPQRTGLSLGLPYQYSKAMLSAIIL